MQARAQSDNTNSSLSFELATQLRPRAMVESFLTFGNRSVLASRLYVYIMHWNNYHHEPHKVTPVPI